MDAGNSMEKLTCVFALVRGALYTAVPPPGKFLLKSYIQLIK